MAEVSRKGGKKGLGIVLVNKLPGRTSKAVEELCSRP